MVRDNISDGLFKFMRGFTAKKVCPSLDLTPDYEQLFNETLCYIRAGIIKRIIGEVNLETIDRILYEASHLPLEMYLDYMKSLVYVFPHTLSYAEYHQELGYKLKYYGHKKEAEQHFKQAEEINRESQEST